MTKKSSKKNYFQKISAKKRIYDKKYAKKNISAQGFEPWKLTH